MKKWKAKLLKKPVAKKVKVSSGRTTPSKTAPPPPIIGRSRKIVVVKIAWPKTKLRIQGTSEIELALK
jgi:hypothetical protein